MINFKYLNYNFSDKIYIEQLEEFKDNDLIIVESFREKNFLLKYKNLNVFTTTEILDKLYLTDKNIISGIDVFLVLYELIDENFKKILNINNYFDSIEFINNFFEFFSVIKDKNDINKIDILSWQQERIDIFFKLKDKVDRYLDENDLIFSQFLYDEKFFDSFIIKKFNRIVFFDVIEFSAILKNTIKIITKKVDIKIDLFLNLDRGDFDEENFCIKKINFKKNNDSKISLFPYKSDFDLYLNLNYLLSDDKNINKLFSVKKISDKYAIFKQVFTNIFNETKLYKLLEIYLKIYENIDFKENIISILTLRNLFSNSVFMEFYGIDKEDIKTLDKLFLNKYRYISFKEKDDKFFNDNINLKNKLSLIYSLVKDIDEIKKIEDLNQFFKKYLFNSNENLNYFMENKYLDIYDKFYEILGILSFFEKTEYRKNYANIFSKNLGKNIFKLFFNYLNNIELKLAEDNSDKRLVRNIKDMKYENRDARSIVFFSNFNFSLADSFFSEEQKRKLNLKTKEDNILEQKYRFFECFKYSKNLIFVAEVDKDKNLDFPSFVYEYLLLNEYSYFEKLNIDNFFSSLSEKKLLNEIEKYEKKHIGLVKKLSDFNNILKIGAYDYKLIMENETFYFLDKICGLEPEIEFIEEIGISSAILGKIIHKTMEDFFRKNWKDILKSNSIPLNLKDEIEENLINNFKREKLKIEIFMENYISNIIIPRISKNILVFLEKISEILILNDEKIERIEAERTERKETVFKRIAGVEIILNGRADLIIETKKAVYIIDFKTSDSSTKNLKQLDFYAIMLYRDSKKEIFEAAYNLWNQNELAIKKVENLDLIIKEFEEKLSNFVESDFYTLPKKNFFSESMKNDFNNYKSYKHLCFSFKGDDDE